MNCQGSNPPRVSGAGGTALNTSGRTSVTARVLSLVQLATEIPKTFGGPFIYLFFKSFFPFLFVRLLVYLFVGQGLLKPKLSWSSLLSMRMTLTS